MVSSSLQVTFSLDQLGECVLHTLPAVRLPTSTILVSLERSQEAEAWEQTQRPLIM